MASPHPSGARPTARPSTAPALRRRPVERLRSGRLPVGRLQLLCWAATRAVLLLCVLKVLVVPGPDVTSDVAVIYRNWAEVLRSGSFPVGDVTWQYPPGAALAVLSPGLLPFLSYPHAFFALLLAADAAVLALLVRTGRRPGHRPAGAWVWIAGVALLGPTGYARYDLMVTAVAVAALCAAARRPRLSGALIACGALLKVWPVLLLCGAPLRGRRARALWGAAAVCGAALTLGCALAAPGAFAFLTAQRDRGTEVESLGALVFHGARHLGWPGEVVLRYGSLEFVGPLVPEVSAVATALTAAALGWLLWWRLRAGLRTAPRPAVWCDAAFTAVLLATVTSRVISPQYLLWPVGLGAVCLTVRASRQTLPVLLVLAATGLTCWEFPLWFDRVVASDGPGLTLLLLRDALLVWAALLAARRLWRTTVRRTADGTEEADGPVPEPDPEPAPGEEGADAAPSAAPQPPGGHAPGHSPVRSARS
ncbi:glycosyltransferase family 87 protein [Streptomyces catenulae]|uniref:Glycosyltransferase family 87 protein n=2 Tax=Streptomyces catenulae TaxID=66875 RepID=A0ABV2Z8X9_9ACTN|nr:glycosyltransferase family 87 protein [Streptomyces catenulae]